MVLIYPVLRTNRERHYVAHTVIFLFSSLQYRRFVISYRRPAAVPRLFARHRLFWFLKLLRSGFSTVFFFLLFTMHSTPISMPGNPARYCFRPRGNRTASHDRQFQPGFPIIHRCIGRHVGEHALSRRHYVRRCWAFSALFSQIRSGP